MEIIQYSHYAQINKVRALKETEAWKRIRIYFNYFWLSLTIFVYETPTGMFCKE